MVGFPRSLVTVVEQRLISIERLQLFLALNIFTVVDVDHSMSRPHSEQLWPSDSDARRAPKMVSGTSKVINDDLLAMVYLLEG